jgi:hypothetical protein
MSQSAPAGGYKESDHRPSVKLARIPTAPTAILAGRRKPCRTAYFQAVDSRAVFVVEGGNHPLTVDPHNNTDRKKVLQIATIRTMRAVLL